MAISFAGDAVHPQFDFVERVDFERLAFVRDVGDECVPSVLFVRGD